MVDALRTYGCSTHPGELWCRDGAPAAIKVVIADDELRSVDLIVHTYRGCRLPAYLTERANAQPVVARRLA